MIRNGWSFHGILGLPQKMKRNMEIRKTGKQYGMNRTNCVFTGVDDVKFYLPEYRDDVVQGDIVFSKNYYEITWLEKLEAYCRKYFPVVNVLDIGANIGNHSLYFCKKMNANKVYSFEPVVSTFDILTKNIEINRVSDKIIPFNCGLGEEEYQADIIRWIENNRGGAAIDRCKTGSIPIKTLDSFDLSNITLIKIDVEQHEANVLKGAKRTISENKPIIAIEIEQENFNYVNQLLKELNYQLLEKNGWNHIYVPCEKYKSMVCAERKSIYNHKK